MLRTIFAPKSISNKRSTAVAPITSNTATVGESGVLFQIDGRDSVVLLDRVITIEKGRPGKFLGELGDEKALAIATPSMSTRRSGLSNCSGFCASRQFENFRWNLLGSVNGEGL